MAYAVKVDEITRGLLAECAAKANRTPGKHVKDLIEADAKERGIVAPKAAPKVARGKRSVHEMARDIVASTEIPDGRRYKWREIGETGDGEEYDTTTGEATGNKVEGFFAWKVKERLRAKS